MGPQGCRFCLENGLLLDAPVLQTERFYLLGSIVPDRPAQALVVPHRHIETPFELSIDEWGELRDVLVLARKHLSSFGPDGYTIGWNVGAVAGQEVFHAHLHVIARFAGEPSAGRGIHYALR